MISFSRYTRGNIYLNGDPAKLRGLGAIGTKANLPATPYNLRKLKEHITNDPIFDNLCKTIFNEHKEVIPSLTNFKGELRPYQMEDLKFFLRMGSGCNFSEQRTGKTPTTLAYVAECNLPTIFICPSSVQLLTWKPQIEKFLGVVPTTMFKKSEKKGLTARTAMNPKDRLQVYEEFNRGNVKYLIISKDTWKADFEKVSITGDYLLVVDEAHFMRSHRSTTKTTKQCKAVLALRSKAKNCIVLTGTPVSSHPSEVYGCLHLAQPNVFGSYYAFCEYFWSFGDHYKPRLTFKNSNRGREELREWVSKYAVQHKQKDVMQWLPSIVHDTVEIDMTAKQAKMYYEVMLNYKYKNLQVANILTQIITLRQISNVGYYKSEFNGEIECEEYLGSGKIDWLKSYISEHEDEKILILSEFSNKTIPHIANALKDFAPEVITGQTNKTDMKRSIDLIQGGYKKYLIANLQVVSAGITLDKIDTIIFFDRSFSPEVNSQVESRFLPTDINHLRDKEKYIIDLISTNPVDFASWKEFPNTYDRLKSILDDEGIYKLLDKKISITKVINELNEKYGTGKLKWI